MYWVFGGPNPQSHDPCEHGQVRIRSHMVDDPMISAVTAHKVENSDLNPSTCEFPTLRVSHQTIPQWYLSSGLMHSLLAAYADPVVFTNVMLLRGLPDAPHFRNSTALVSGVAIINL